MSFSSDHTDRRHPTHGVWHQAEQTTIVLVTVCSKDRVPWLATHAVHEQLRRVWTASEAWRIGRYVIMPDHIHLFATPAEPYIELDKWIRYWKSLFTRAHKPPPGRWQIDFWDRRLRRDESYEDAWSYLYFNPVRHGLVERPETWPFQGEVNELQWN